MKFINKKYRTDHNKDLNKLLPFMDKSKYNKKHRSDHNQVRISESMIWSYWKNHKYKQHKQREEIEFTSDISGATFRRWINLGVLAILDYL
jgi:histone acetyltransferase (RNA polymerase elongator complex component)